MDGEMNLIRGSLVARRVIILAEYTFEERDHSYNNETISLILERMSLLSNDDHHHHHRVISDDDIKFHVLLRDDLVFLCISNKIVADRLCADFLDEICTLFTKEYGDGSYMPTICLPYSMNEFSKTMKRTIDKWSAKVGDYNQPITTAEAEEETTSPKDASTALSQEILVTELKTLLSRGDNNLNDPRNRKDKLYGATAEFQRKAIVLRRKEWWKNLVLLLFASSAISMIVFLMFQMST